MAARAPLASVAAVQNRQWVPVLTVCAVLAVASLVLNITVPGEMEGRLEAWSFVRKSLSKVLSAGTVWAGLAVWAGWRLRHPLRSMVAGVCAAEVTLVLHYGLGWLLGVYDATIWSSNSMWFAAGILLCAPLGLCGWIVSRPGWLGLAARLVVSAGALAEPWVTHRFSPWPEIPWPERYSDIVSGVVLVALGLVLTVLVVRHGLRGFDHPDAARRSVAPAAAVV